MSTELSWRSFLLTILAASSFAGVARSQAPAPPAVEILDLSKPQSVTRSINPDRPVQIIVKNMAPGRGYAEDVQIVVHEIPALPLLSTKSMKSVPPPESEQVCKSLLDAFNELNDVKLDEGKVLEKAAVVTKELAQSSCTDKTLRENCDLSLKRIDQDLGVRAVTRGESIVVTVSRADTSKSWTLTLDAGVRGEWLGTYGFVFSPPGDETYFSKTLDGGKFQITRAQDRGGLRFTPIVFYSWLPAAQANKDFAFGLTAGLGFESERPNVALGGTVFFNHNIQIVGGMLMRSVKRLDGKYDKGALPVLTENLSDDQLHTRTYRPIGFFGVTFRFDKSPFASNKSGGSGNGSKPSGGTGQKSGSGGKT